MDHVRIFAAQVRTKYRILQQTLWQYEPKKDFFRVANNLLIVSGVCFEPATAWSRVGWTCYQGLAVCHFFLTLAHFIEALVEWTHLVPIIWNFVEFFMMCTALAKSAMIRHHMDAIQRTQKFVNDRLTTSGDVDEDLKARKLLFKMTQLLPGIMLGIIGTVIILVGITIGPDDPLFGQPQVFHRNLSGWKARVVHLILNSSLFPIWVGKTYCSAILISCLLMGIKTELIICTRGFGDVCDEFDNLGFENFRDAFMLYAKQHVRILDQLQQLQLLIRFDFLIIYYGGLITIGSLIFIPTTDGLTIGSFVLSLGITAFFIECYLWCWLVESFQDVNDTIEEQVMDVIVKIPYDARYHSEYVRMRTRLMIMKICTRFSAKFNCGGVFDITVEAVGNMMNITYSLVTFLLNFI